ncbi:MAG: carboxymuconolactone decarboxylase family protein [Acidobacteriota bacterium]|nr:carboxymuconolactone decarboxylase family protein [Acidobacteriota bacterium]
MTQRLDYVNAAPEVFKKMYALEAYLKHCGLELSLQELVKFRISQINGCAYCLDMHSKDARAAGESEQRLYCLSAWRETPFYTERERAALEWAEHLTLISEKHVPDDLFERVRKHFSDEELVNLTLAVTMINSWNRFAISFQSEVGSYQSAKATA